MVREATKAVMLLRWLQRLLAVCAVILPIQAGSAQIPTSSQEVRTTPGSQAQHRIEISDRQSRIVADCVVTRVPVRVRKLLETVPKSRNEDRITTSMQSRMDWCFRGSGGVRFTDFIWRGFLAEKMIGNMDRSAIARSLKTPPADRAWIGDFGDLLGDNKGVIGMPMFGRCVAAARPATALRLIESEPFSKQQASTFRELGPVLSPCIDDGITGEFSPQTLRAVIAEGLYHYFRVAGVAAPSGGGG